MLILFSKILFSKYMNKMGNTKGNKRFYSENFCPELNVLKRHNYVVISLLKELAEVPVDNQDVLAVIKSDFAVDPDIINAYNSSDKG